MYKENYVSKHPYVSGSVSYGNPIPIKIGKLTSRYTKRYGTTHVRLFDGRKVVLNIAMSPVSWRGINAYKIDSAYVQNKYQGNGICKQFYTKMIVQKGLPILSTGSHSTGAAKTWLRVSQHKDVVAYGFSVKGPEIWKLGPNKDNTELTRLIINKTIYDSNECLGIILVKKSSAADKILSAMCKKVNKSKTGDIFGNTNYVVLGTDY